MASSKEVRNQIASIGNTQKITSAMEKVAASKMKKTEARMAKGRPYRNRMLEVISHLANGQPEYKPTFMQEREVKNVSIINNASIIKCINIMSKYSTVFYS